MKYQRSYYSQFARILILLLFVGAVTAEETTHYENYALPRSKSNLETCKRLVLNAHVGRIERQIFQQRHGREYSLYGIQADDGSEWNIICDSVAGKIINEQKLDLQ